jgi:hypothetical protein
MDGAAGTDFMGDPDEIIKYNARGPAMMTSTEVITSQYPEGQAFSKADDAAIKKLVEYCRQANAGIQGFRNKAKAVGDAYMNTEQGNTALIKSIDSPSVSPNGDYTLPATNPAAQSPIPDPPSNDGPPPTILAPGPLDGSGSGSSGPVA